MILVDHEIPSTRLDINIPGLESLTTSISLTPTTKIVIVTLYRRSSTVSIERFIAMIEQLLSDTTLLHAQILVVGDFNEDLMGNTNKISSYFETKGFNQLIGQPTTNIHYLSLFSPIPIRSSSGRYASYWNAFFFK